MSEHSRGPANAPVTLVEYGDYECPHCALARHVLSVVLAELGDEVRFVFRNFPITILHSDALAAAEAAESVAAHAGEEAFWTMHDILFENQDALEIDDLLTYAEAAGADPQLVADDLASSAMREGVRADVESGVSRDVVETPAFFVNGRPYEGDWSDADSFTEGLQEAARARMQYH